MALRNSRHNNLFFLPAPLISSNYKLAGVYQRLSLIGGGNQHFADSLAAMSALYAFIVGMNSDKSFKDLYMAPFGNAPAMNSATRFVTPSRGGQTTSPCINFPMDIDSDGSVKEVADRWGLRFTEDNHVMVKGIGLGSNISP